MSKKKRIIILKMILSLMLMGPVKVVKAKCHQWSSATTYGKKMSGKINEVSGMTTSAQFDGRIYHVNDESIEHFFITNLQGRNLQEVKIKKTTIEDPEDISIGPCGNNQCLFLADIGDNFLKRNEIQIVLITETEKFDKKVRPYGTLHVTYPDQMRHNAEALSVHPKTGDIFLVTKELHNRNKESSRLPPAKIYRLSQTVWSTYLSLDHKEKVPPLKWEKIGEVNMSAVVKSPILGDQAVTAMDIAPDGKSFVLLTYGDAFEFHRDLSDVSHWPEEIEKEAHRVSLERLIQQEGISYGRNEQTAKKMYYHSEFKGSKKGNNARIMELSCKN